jgi:hypothetical protein
MSKLKSLTHLQQQRLQQLPENRSALGAEYDSETMPESFGDIYEALQAETNDFKDYTPETRKIETALVQVLEKMDFFATKEAPTTIQPKSTKKPTAKANSEAQNIKDGIAGLELLLEMETDPKKLQNIKDGISGLNLLLELL